MSVMEKISTVAELIDLWPTRAALAAEMTAACPDRAVTAGRVHKWAKTNSVPSKYHYQLLEVATSRGWPVTAALIIQLHAPNGRAA